MASCPRDRLNDGSGTQNTLSQGTFQVALRSSGGKLHVFLFSPFSVLLCNGQEARAENHSCKAGGFRRKCAQRHLRGTNTAGSPGPGPHPKPESISVREASGPRSPLWQTPLSRSPVSPTSSSQTLGTDLQTHKPVHFQTIRTRLYACAQMKFLYVLVWLRRCSLSKTQRCKWRLRYANNCEK